MTLENYVIIINKVTVKICISKLLALITLILFICYYNRLDQ